MLRGVAELNASYQLPCPLRLKGLVERALGVRVQVVSDNDDFVTVGISAFEQAGHLDSPIDLGFSLTHGNLSPSARAVR